MDLFDRQSGTRLGIVLKQVAKCHEQLRSMLDTSVVERLVNVVNDHHSNRCRSVWLVEQVARERCSGNFWNMFMFTNRRDLLLI